MKEILKLNAISQSAVDVLGADYKLTDKPSAPAAVMLRSFSMHDYDLPQSVLAVARAGAGTNNIPSDAYAERGVVVFNTPALTRMRSKSLRCARCSCARAG